MKKYENCKQFKNTMIMALIIFIIMISMGCATFVKKETGPKLGPANDFQKILNNMPAVQISGRATKFQFGGNGWISRVEGKPTLGGTFASEVSAGRTILRLTPTHTYSNQQHPVTKKDVGWVKTPGNNVIVLEFNPGPPTTLTPRIRN